MNNLPEGVSASDPHVAGVTETDSFQTVGECESLGRMAGPRGVICMFDGADDVPGVLVADRIEVRFIWHCPQCDTQNETVMPDDILDPDPDRYRD